MDKGGGETGTYTLYNSPPSGRWHPQCSASHLELCSHHCQGHKV